MANLRADNLCGVGFVSANDGTVWSNYITGGTLSGSYPATNGFDGNISNFVYAAVDGTMVWTAPNGGIKAGRIEVYVYAGNTHPIVEVNGKGTGAVVGSATPAQLGNWVDVTELVDGHLKTITCYGQEISGVDRQSGFAAVRINGEILTDSLVGTKGGRNAIDGSILLESSSKSRISVTNTTGLDFGTDQFTIEFWIYLVGIAPVSKNIFARSTSNSGTTGMIMWFDSNGHLEWDSAHGASGAIHTGAGIGNHMWHHIAVSRDSSNNTRLYLNGVLKGTASSDTTDIVGATNLQIASNIAGDGYYNDAYISNFRMVKGTAVYSGTTDFTPPTEKLTAIDGTVLLCCQDSDNALQEATGKTITGYGRYFAATGEKFANTGFTADSDWTKGSGWTIANGLATHAQGSAGDLYQSVSGLVAGQIYKLSVDVISTDNDVAYFYIDGYPGSNYPTLTPNDTSPVGNHFIYFAAPAATVNIGFRGSSLFAGTITNLRLSSADHGKAPKVLPPVGVDAGVTFEGDIKMNSQGYMYFPTGDTSQRGRGRGVISQGMNPSSVLVKTLQYIEIQSMGNTVDFGDNTDESYGATAVSSSTRGITALGATSNSSPYTVVNTLDYITIATTANATDFGDLAVKAMHKTGMSNNTRGVFAAGFQPNTRVMDYVTIATTGNAADFGDSIGGRFGMNQSGQAGSSTRGLLAGGESNSAPFEVNKIQYITFATAADSQDFGDLNDNNGYFNIGASSDTRAVFAGGDDLDSPYPTTDRIDYVTIATLGNATDFGNLSVSRYIGYGMSNGTRGVFAGGVTIPGPTIQNTIDYVTIATTGNANDFGDMTEPVRSGGGISDSHGGLS